MKKILIQPKASLDLDKQALFIAKNNLQLAYKFYEACDQAFQQISKMPQLGQRYSTKNKQLAGIRFLPVRGFENHLIFYVSLKSSLEIIRILYATRDIKNILSKYIVGNIT